MDERSLSLVHLAREPEIVRGESPPLLLLLHGIGSYEGDLFGLAPHLDGRFLIVSARAPLSLGPGAFGWYHVEYSPAGLVISASEAEASRQILVRFIEELIESYQADPTQVYLLGFSQGAAICLSVLLSRPDVVAGVVVMSGRLISSTPDKARAPEGLDGLPVLVVHGTEDQVLSVEYGRQIRDYLRSLPVALTYEEYSMAHQVTPESLQKVASWLSERLDATGA